MPYAHMTEAQNSETAFFVDSLDTNATTYFYRIAGVTPFGETGPVSNVVKGQGKNSLSGLLIIREGKIFEEQPEKTKTKPKKDKITQTSNGFSVKIAWEFPIAEEKQINGFVIARANNADGPYSDIGTGVLPAATRNYIDVTNYNNTYYQVRAVDKLKNEVAHSYPFLVQVEDNTPPQIPSNIIGSIDSVGIVSLSWKPCVDTDIMGYRIFRANSLHEEPVEVTTSILNQTAYRDTVNMNVLNKKIFYYAVAVDKNYNASDYSAPFVLSRPDNRPPAEPVFTRVEVVKDTVILEWMNSASDDVAKYDLIRMESDTMHTILTWTQATKRNSYFDKPKAGKVYRYKLMVHDSAGNSSVTSTERIVFESGFRKAVNNIKGTADREKRVITLTWKKAEAIEKSIIYRKENDGSYILYKTLDGNISSMVDKNISINNAYTYKVQVVYTGGIKSILSEGVQVKY